MALAILTHSFAARQFYTARAASALNMAELRQPLQLDSSFVFTAQNRQFSFTYGMRRAQCGEAPLRLHVMVW